MTCIAEFLAAPTHKRFEMVLDSKSSSEIREYLGSQVYEQYAALAHKVMAKLKSTHLSVKAPKNLIFIPGVMGSSIQSETYGGTWWLDLRALHHIDDLKLSTDGQSDADPNFSLSPGTTDITYEPFLGAVLAREDFGHVIFPYDWRKSFDVSTRLLRDKINDIYRLNGRHKIHLVTHSMGGLLARATLMEHGSELWPKLGRIVFIGTPHYGSPAIASYLKNHLWGFPMMFLLGKYLSRETFRSLYGVLNLLPAPIGVYPGTRANDSPQWRSGEKSDTYQHPCANFDLYDVDSWNLELTDLQRSHLAHVLRKISNFYAEMYSAHEGLPQEYCDRMAVIAGVGYKTLFRLSYEVGFYGLWEHTKKITGRIKGDLHREGDGSVPLASAALENVGSIRYIKGKHQSLPNISAVYDDVFRWLNGEMMKLPKSPSGALTNHLAESSFISDAPSLDGSDEDTDRWQSEECYLEDMPELEIKLSKGQLLNFMTVRLL